MLQDSRKIASDLGLEMGINDVEFQGDGRKVTLFYTAGGHVDFRELIRHYAAAFGVKVEMRRSLSGDLQDQTHPVSPVQTGSWLDEGLGT